MATVIIGILDNDRRASGSRNILYNIARYGRQMVAFLPVLLLGTRWRMWSTVKPPYFGKRLTYYTEQ
jgi:predicted nuclease of restriction endonuclease-like RecB superfamily